MSEQNGLKQFDLTCVLSDYAFNLRNGDGLYMATQKVMMDFMINNTEDLIQCGNKESHLSVLMGAIHDAVDFDYNRRDQEYSDFHYKLYPHRITGRKLGKCFSSKTY